MSNKEVNKEEGRILREVVVLFIYNEEGEVLFTKRSQNCRLLPGIWALPSGHIEEGESFEDTVIREAQEELNIQVQGVGLDEIIHEPGGDNTKVHLVRIPATSYGGIPIINSDELETIAWMRTTDFYKRFSDAEIGSTLRYLRPKFQKND